jgi:AcrR family transcriptional regulator
MRQGNEWVIIMTDSTRQRDSGDPTADPALAQRILDVALALGEQHGWDGLHLYQIARAMDITLADVRRHYDQKDALAEAWFARADAALLAAAETPGWRELSARQRVAQAVFAWLDALAPHRRLTAAMLGYKLQPEHVHLQVCGLLRISRTVQWLREVAGLPSVGWRREVEEVALTGIYLSTFACWLRDDSPDAARAHAWLEQCLAVAERTARWIAPA